MTERKVALVTGASYGIGQATAEMLAARGWRVFGTSRTARESPAGQVEMLVLDVRSDESVGRCVGQVMERAGRLDLLVNNAGFVHADPLEETTLEEVRALFETNFFGLVRVTHAVLPILRRQAGGRIINVGSIAGRVGVPGEGFYSATKFAVEGYSEALRYEVEPLGIQVVLVEPGVFKPHLRAAMTTSSHPIADYDALRGSRPGRPASARGRSHPIADYDALRESLRKLYKEGPPVGADPSLCARVIVRAAEARRPRLRYLAGRDAVWLMRARRLLPECLFAAGMRRFLKSAKRPMRYE